MSDKPDNGEMCNECYRERVGLSLGWAFAELHAAEWEHHARRFAEKAIILSKEVSALRRLLQNRDTTMPPPPMKDRRHE